MPETEFSRKLRRFRKDANLTQRELAERYETFGAPLSPSMISHLERGRRDPSSSEVVRNLAKSLHLDQSETSQLLLTAGFTTSVQPEQDTVPGEFRKSFAHMTDPEFIRPFRTPFMFPELEAIDDSLTSFLRAWRDHAEIREALRRRQWNDAAEKAHWLQDSLRSIFASLTCYVADAEGLARHHRGQVAVAERLFQRSKFYARQSGDERATARCAVHLGDLFKNTARLDEAWKEYEEATEIYHTLGDRRQSARVKRKVGTWYLFQGIWREALPRLQDSLMTFGRLGDKYEVSHTHHSLGWACSLGGEWDSAVSHHLTGLKLTEELNQERGWEDEYNLLRGHLYLGDDLRQVGRYGEAQRHLEGARDIAGRIKEEYERGRILLCLAKLYRQMGPDYRGQAQTLAQRSCDFHFEKGNDMRLAQSLNHLGRIHADLGQDAEAEEQYKQSVSLCQRIGVRNHYYEAAAFVNLCDLYSKTDQGQRVDECAKTAERICEEYEYNQHLARLKLVLAESAVINEKLPLKAAAYCDEAYRYAYLFNEYLADEIHRKVRDLLTETMEKQGVANAEVLRKQLHKDLNDSRSNLGGWYLTLVSRLQDKVDSQIRELSSRL